jgi:DNA N-6-adenine-methyltransferase (Dam)
VSGNTARKTKAPSLLLFPDLDPNPNPRQKSGGMGSHHSSNPKKDEWLTPPGLLKALGHFDLDPCAPVNRPWPIAAKHLTWRDNGLLAWHGRVWCNPPYGKETGHWLARCAEHQNATALVFARTETDDWQNHVWPKAHAIFFLKGRLHFHHTDGTRSKDNGGAPSALIAFDEANTRALEQSGLAGKLVRL